MTTKNGCIWRTPVSTTVSSRHPRVREDAPASWAPGLGLRSPSCCWWCGIEGDSRSAASRQCGEESRALIRCFCCAPRLVPGNPHERGGRRERQTEPQRSSGSNPDASWRRRRRGSGEREAQGWRGKTEESVGVCGATSQTRSALGLFS